MGDYPDIDDEKRRSVLPTDLQQQLAQVAQAKKNNSRHITDALIEGIDCALANLPPETLPRAGAEIPMRAGLYRRDRTKEQTLLHLRPGLAWLFLFHGDGYLREDALTFIKGGAPGAFQVCSVAYRLNDWVPQVRTAAASCLGRLIRRTSASVLVEAAVYLLTARRYWQRGSLEIAVIDDIVSRDDVRDRLVQYIMSKTQGTPHRVLMAASAETGLDLELPRLLDAAHPAVRALVATFLAQRKIRWAVGFETQWIDKSMGRSRCVTRYAHRDLTIDFPSEACLARIAADRSSQVRKVAMQAIIDAPDLWSERDALIQKLKNDRSAVIRAGMDFIRRQQAKESLDPSAQ